MVEGVLEKWFTAQNNLHWGNALLCLVDLILIHGWNYASLIMHLLIDVENHIEQNSPWDVDQNPGANILWYSFKRNWHMFFWIFLKMYFKVYIIWSISLAREFELSHPHLNVGVNFFDFANNLFYSAGEMTLYVKVFPALEEDPDLISSSQPSQIPGLGNLIPSSDLHSCQVLMCTQGNTHTCKIKS